MREHNYAIGGYFSLELQALKNNTANEKSIFTISEGMFSITARKH